MIIADCFTIFLDGDIPCLLCGRKYAIKDYNWGEGRKAECGNCTDEYAIWLSCLNWREQGCVGNIHINTIDFYMVIGCEGYTINNYDSYIKFKTYCRGKTKNILDKDIKMFTNNWMKNIVVFK